MFDLTGKTAIITGGNGGIGLAIAEALLAANCAVSIWGRNPGKTAQAADHLRGKGGRVHSMVCDVTDAAAVGVAFDATVAEFKRIDGCFINAGMGGGGIVWSGRD